MVWSGNGAGQLSVPGRPISLVDRGQGTTVFAVGASGAVWIIFFRLQHIFHFSLSLGDGLTQTEIVSKYH